MTKITQAQSIEKLSFEQILQSQKDWLIQRDSALGAVLAIESETITKLIENFAYRELYIRQRINDGIKATMISTAIANDLDNLLLLLGVERLTITPADDATTPPKPALLEDDESYRKRGLLVLESFSTAGPKLAYEYHALGVVGVHDVKASSTSNGVVDIVIMGDQGMATEALLTAVSDQLSDEKIRPLGTQLAVASATQVDYQIQALLRLDDTPSASLALASARNAIDVYVASRFKIGKDIHVSSIYAALQQAGVESVSLISHTDNITIDNTQFAKCLSVDITS